MGLYELAKELKNLENYAREGKNTESYPSIVAVFKKETAEAVQELTLVTDNLELYF
jgi:hypothetical protein